MDEKLIVASEIGGLGNRIKAWISVRRMSPDGRVHWPLNRFMPMSFRDLFENDCDIDEIPENARVYRSWRLHLEPEDLIHLPEGFSPVSSTRHSLLRYVDKRIWEFRGRSDDRFVNMPFPKTNAPQSARPDARHIDLEYARIPDYFIETFAPLFAEVRPQSSIRERVEKFATQSLDRQSIGVQVRSWRDDPRRHRKYFLPALKRLVILMADQPATSRFLVVSDSDHVVTDLQKRFGTERVMSFTRQTSRDDSWQSPLGVEEDLIDMLLLSRTNTIFTSYLSTFGETAWWLGGARAAVRVF